MKLIKNLSVKASLAIGFAAVVLVGVVIAVYGAYKLTSISHEQGDLASTDPLGKALILSSLRDSTSDVSRYAAYIAISGDEDYRNFSLMKIDGIKKKVDSDLKQLADAFAGSPYQSQFEKIKAAYDPYNTSIANLVTLANKGRKEDSGEVVLGELRTLQNKLQISIEELRAKQIAAARDNATQGEADARLGGYQMLGLSGAMVVIGIIISMSIARSITGELGAEPGELRAMTIEIAHGNLSSPINVRSDDNFSVVSAIAKMQASLLDLVRHVRESSDVVANSSAEIAQGNRDLSVRTEQQALALQATASTFSQLSATVSNSTENAAQANKLAEKAAEIASHGGGVVSEVVSTMRGINQSSQKISEIIGVIDGIAFQTNILALNAAVEAARAGEQGRGFAVVASEVRSLAQRSAEAAKEIKHLISQSVGQVEEGTHLVEDAGKTMDNIVGSIQRVRDIVASISAASYEQSDAINMAVQSVNEIENSTQKNAALVEETAAAANTMDDMAQQLVRSVEAFKI